ncbi:hypothetical protein KEM56_007471 [Ascosphaera pollenicola]|nr:hypothetical protein KEM56_007471 [Ascosphaera pollenicola]
MQLGLQSLAVLVALVNGGSCLQPSDISPETPLSQLLSSANSHLAGGSPNDALVYFDAAIARDPSNYLTIFQRGAAYLSVGKNSKALADFDRALELRPKFEGALLQRGRLHVRGASWDDAKKDFKAVGSKAADELAELETARKASRSAEKAEKKGDWDACVKEATVAIDKAPLSVDLRQRRSRCNFEQGDIVAGTRDLSHVLQLAPCSIEPYLHISNMLFFSLAETERGIAEARKCLRSDPDSKQCSRLMRREKQIAKAIKQADEFKHDIKYSKALDILLGKQKEGGLIDEVKAEEKEARDAGHIHRTAPSNLYTDLLETTCQLLRETKSKQRAHQYCQEVLQRNPHSLQGFLNKAERQIDADEFEDAIRTLNGAREHHSESVDIQKLMQKAQTLLRRSKEKDYYKVLEVDRDADAQTIKRAYRRLSKIHHPDRASSTGVTKEAAEKKMAELNEAYEVLSNPELKARFDHGDDPYNPQGPPPGGNPFQGGQFNPSFVFQQGSRQKFQGHGFPGQGFPFQGFPGFF